MKRPGLTLHLVSATLFLVTAVVSSLAGQERMASEGMQSKRGEELLKRFDKNGDGKLDDDERADAKEAMMQDQLNRQMTRTGPGGSERFRRQALDLFDKNRDGRLDDEERAEARKFAETVQGAMAGLDQLTQRFDQNANGRIDPDERAQIDDFLMELRDLGAGRARGELLREFDRNTDSRIDAAEMSELEKFIRPRIEADPAQLRRHDKNNDGFLDEAEWKAARAAIELWLNAKPSVAAPSPPTAQEEMARLEKVAAEVARRRAEREKVISGSAPKPILPASDAPAK